LLDSQIIEEGFNFGSIHFFAVTFVVKENKLCYPVDICLFGANRIMFTADRLANLIEQFWGLT
jgi:hypothetical protein